MLANTNVGPEAIESTVLIESGLPSSNAQPRATPVAPLTSTADSASIPPSLRMVGSIFQF